MTNKKLTKKEVEKVILDLSNEGMTSEKIGLTLKDKHGIKNFREEYGMKITQITGKNDADIKNVRKRLEKLQKHFTKNKKDQPAKRKLIKTSAHIKKIEKYLLTN